MKTGDKVIIKHNPHQTGYDKIIGTVISVRKGAAHGGADMVEVTYPGIRDGLSSFPFADYNLEPTTTENLLEIARHHEELAAYCRKLAKETQQ